MHKDAAREAVENCEGDARGVGVAASTREALAQRDEEGEALELRVALTEAESEGGREEHMVEECVELKLLLGLDVSEGEGVDAPLGVKLPVPQALPESVTLSVAVGDELALPQRVAVGETDDVAHWLGVLQ